MILGFDKAQLPQRLYLAGMLVQLYWVPCSPMRKTFFLTETPGPPSGQPPGFSFLSEGNAHFFFFFSLVVTFSPSSFAKQRCLILSSNKLLNPSISELSVCPHVTACLIRGVTLWQSLPCSYILNQRVLETCFLTHLSIYSIWCYINVSFLFQSHHQPF